MPGPVFLADGDVSLRPATADDLDFLRENEQDPRVRASRSAHRPVDEEDARRRLGGAMGRTDDSLALVVCHDAAPVGFVYLIRERPNDGLYRAGELAYWITPDEWGNGYATAAGELVLDHAFGELGLHRVDASTFVTNESSRRVLSKLGFVEEGRSRRAAFVDGEWVDTVEFGLLESDWFEAVTDA